MPNHYIRDLLPTIGISGLSRVRTELLHLAVVAALTPHPVPMHRSPMRLITSYHLMEQTVFVSKLGLVVFVFLVAAYFHLSWDCLSFGILLGLGISACVELAAWAFIANAIPSVRTRTLF